MEKYKRPIFIASVAVFTVLYTVECNPELIIYRFISQSNGVLMTRLHNYIAILAAMLVIPVIILLMFLVFGKIKIGNKLLFFLGGISYQLYMIHMLCGGIVERLAAGYIDNVWAVFILKLVVSTIAAAGMKWVTDKILCKLK